MDLSAIVDEFNRRKAQAGQRIGDMFTKKPDDWFQQMKQTQQNAVTTPEQRDNIHKTLADIANRMAEGMVPPMIRERDRASRTDPSAAAKPFTSEEIKQATPFVTAAAPIAYHGTPHSFEKFDASKIGTGQGAASYGHGLYFAENVNTANSYMRDLSETKDAILNVGGKEIRVPQWLGKEIQSGNLDEPIKDWTNRIAEAKVNKRTDQISGLTPMLEAMKEAKATGKFEVKLPGNMYQVNIPDQHAAKMLDWDAPLSQQPEIEKLLPSLGFKQTLEGHWQGPQGGPISRTNPMGGEMVVSAVGSSERGSRLLKEAGIPGIKYLDQGSRVQSWVEQSTGGKWRATINTPNAASKSTMFDSQQAAEQFVKQEGAKGTRNFVVFDPAILQDVTRK